MAACRLVRYCGIMDVHRPNTALHYAWAGLWPFTNQTPARQMLGRNFGCSSTKHSSVKRVDRNMGVHEPNTALLDFMAKL